MSVMLLTPSRRIITPSDCRLVNQLLTAVAIITVFIVQSAVDCLLLAPVYWNNSNPLFKTSQNSHIIEVNLNDEIDFVCPHVSHNNTTSNSTADTGFYIIYQVTRQEYENCIIYSDTAPLMILNCSNPTHRKRFTILFELFQAIPNVSEFVPGATYYYITTSSGSRDGVHNTELGACYYDNMRLIIRVCCTEASGGGDDMDDNDVILQQTNTLPKVTSLRPSLRLPYTSSSSSVSDEKSVVKKVDELQVNDVLPKHDRLLNKSVFSPSLSLSLHTVTMATTLLFLFAR